MHSNECIHARTMDDTQRDEIKTRRQDELEALQAFYGHQLRSSLPALSPPPRSGDTSNANDDDDDSEISLTGPWFIELIDNSGNSSSSTYNSYKIPTLEIRLPPHYPLSPPPSSQNASKPTPILHHVDNHNLLTSLQKQALIEELMEMYEPDMDMAIMWAERCREEFLDVDLSVMPTKAADTSNNDAAENNDNCDDKQQSLSIRFLTFNHLLYGKSHKKESQIVSLAGKSGLVGFIVYGTPGIIGLLMHSDDDEDILDFAKECSNRIGKRATVSDFEMNIAHDGGLLSSHEYDSVVVEAEGGRNNGGKNKSSSTSNKKSKSKGTNNNKGNSGNNLNMTGDSSSTPLLVNLLGADRVTATNDSVSIANNKSGLRHFDSLAELKAVLPGGVVQSILGL
uniref:RWD domain-containing protein n=1 Tax=Skeletonema marinoi TaxID=267567 RepID=A0A7S2L6F8_9STRA|mmetsp:Transcript_21363/g.36235  ORF Transcript_21363/g.36235 Transcript_21363/m.36235 type:complete len:396 (+) Transcript_21363:68-1255(+)